MPMEVYTARTLGGVWAAAEAPKPKFNAKTIARLFNFNMVFSG